MVSGGTSSSVGESETHGGSIRSDGKITVGASRSSHFSTETTDLARRFHVDEPIEAEYVVYVLAFIMVVAGGHNGSYYVGMGVAAVFLGVGCSLIYWFYKRPRRQLAAWTRAIAGEGFYCFRDDVAYHPVLADGAEPEIYMKHCFWAARQRQERS